MVGGDRVSVFGSCRKGAGCPGIHVLWLRASVSPFPEEQPTIRSGRKSSSSSSSSSSSGSSPHQHLPAAPKREPRRPDFEVPARMKLKPFIVHNLFRITPKLAGIGGQFGGYQGVCSYLKKHDGGTGCKKWSPLLGGSEMHRKDAIRRLLHWLTSSADCSRQREHMARPLVADASSLPSPAELRERCLAMRAPAGPPLSDVALDLQEGVDPELAPRRTRTKRLAIASSRASG